MRQKTSGAATGAAERASGFADTFAAMTNSLVGIWRLTATRAKSVDGIAADPPYGPTPIGLLTITDGGQMACVLVDGRMGAPGAAQRDYVSYAGTYHIDGSVLTTRVEYSSDPQRVGGDEVRSVTFAGVDNITLTPPLRRKGGQTVMVELDWERLSPVAPRLNTSPP